MSESAKSEQEVNIDWSKIDPKSAIEMRNEAVRLGEDLLEVWDD